MKELMEKGSVSVMNMYVFADLAVYSSGVYRHRWGELLGAHDVKLLGWGVENGEPYWLIANRYAVLSVRWPLELNVHLNNILAGGRLGERMASSRSCAEWMNAHSSRPWPQRRDTTERHSVHEDILFTG